jgi:hypothetical protein
MKKQNNTTAKATKKAYTPINDSDEQNPQYLFSTTASALLAGIAQGLIDPIELAKRELANRGQGINGTWVGFEKAAQELGLTK